LFRAPGAELRRPYFLSLLADAYAQARRFDDGLSALAEAMVAVDKHQEREHEAEIYRLKGELLLRQDDSNITEAQKCFERAIEIARQRRARSMELRDMVSLARLLAKHGRREEAHMMLAGIYNWFIEGFDTPRFARGQGAPCPAGWLSPVSEEQVIRFTSFLDPTHSVAHNSL
jgi:tetratricopeptide (TPR) repeat protein